MSRRCALADERQSAHQKRQYTKVNLMNLSRTTFLSSFAALGIAALIPASAHAQYVFTQIAETTTTTTPAGGTFTGFGNPGLSGSNVTFQADYTGGTGTTGIFANTGAGGTLTTIATNGAGSNAVPGGGTFSSFDSPPSISGSNVAFKANNGIFTNTGSGGALKAIAIGGFVSPTPAGGTFSTFLDTPSISGNNVAFVGNYTRDIFSGTGNQGIFANTGTGGTLTTIATNDAGSNAVPGGGIFAGFGYPGISGSNVVFRGLYTGGTGSDGIFANTGAGGTLIAIATGGTGASAQVSGGGTFSNLGYPSLSGSNVAFRATYTGGTGSDGIFANTGAGGTLTTIATNGSAQAPGGGTFSTFGVFSSISGSNVAFQADYTGGTGTTGIFLSAGGSLTPVITTDTVSPFGSAFSTFNLGPQGLDGTSVVFSYTLADGRSGIALAAIAPEPGTLALLALGGMLVLVRRRISPRR
jgi:hypothetical protein